MTDARADRIVCRCGHVLHDCEPHGAARYWHPSLGRCEFDGRYLTGAEKGARPFMRKSERRRLRRAGIVIAT